MPFSLFLGLKYLKPKRSVTSVITCVSVLGVLLGVAAVIVVRAVMTGFGDLWEKKILDFKPHATISSRIPGEVVTGEDELARKIGVTDVTIASGENKDMLNPLKPVNPEHVKILEEPVKQLPQPRPERPRQTVRQKQTDLAPKTLAARDEIFLPLKWRVTGIFSCGQRDYDSGFCVCSLANARDLMGLEKGVYAIHVKTARPTMPEEFDAACEAMRALVPGCRLLTWREVDRELFGALAVEKNMTAILLMLITIVALFCVMNTLLVLTVQKTPEIGLMKALGFPRRKIMGVFMVHGLVQVTAGTVLGLVAAWLVLRNLQNIVAMLARFGVQVFPQSVYGLDKIPHRLVGADIAWVVVIVYVFGLLAALVPAFLAASKHPVEALQS